ncbi:autotransporter [Janthinobacterium sp. Marseille]|nr:autotransporter [Janthinobacterium sp. Marseille]
MRVVIKINLVRQIKFSLCDPAILKINFWATISILTLGAMCFPAHAQNSIFTGNEISNGPFSSHQQFFYDRSELNASVANTISGGSQYFYDASVLNASVTNAISGGSQYFYDTSVLNASVTNAISGGSQYFYNASVLNVSAAHAIRDGIQRFYGASVLNASADNAISGGGQGFHGSSVLNASGAHAIRGGYQSFSDTSALNASGAHAIRGGVQVFYNASVLNASAANAIRGGIQYFYDASVLNVLVNDALTSNTNIRFGIWLTGRPGGTLKLNGYSTLIGAINNISAGAGIIENGGATDSVLTVDTSVLGNSSFSGLLRDGGTGKFSLVKTGAGTLQLSGISNYTGSTTVTGGTLQAGVRNVFSSASDFTVTTGMLDANGFDQTVASLSNAGTTATNLKGGAVGTTLTVTGDYTGNGGTVLLNTELNDDRSRTDRLRIRGNTTGLSKLAINNVGGLGAQTVEGIRVIQVDGNSGGQFVLSNGDYAIGGQQALVVGAYAYTLQKNGISTPNDGDWYMRSRLKDLIPSPDDPERPLYQAGVPLYETYPQALLALNSVPTMQQRIGNRLWRTGAESNADISTRSDPNTGSWARLEGTAEHFVPTRSGSMARYDIDRYKMQVGLDGLLGETSAGRLFGGLNLYSSNGRTKVSSSHGNGSIHTDGVGFGGTLSWVGDNGFYIDNQAQVTFYDSKLLSAVAGRALVDGNDGYGYTWSTEVGRRFVLSPGWSVTPQLQLMYSKVSFDSFTGAFDTAVALDSGKSVRGRLGLSLDHENAWQAKHLRVYGIVNLYNEFMQGSKVYVAGAPVSSANERLWGGIGVGGSYTWADGKYMVYGEGSANTSLNRFGDSYVIAGIVGIKIAF